MTSGKIGGRSCTGRLSYSRNYGTIPHMVSNLRNDVWSDVAGEWLRHYQVSNDGRVRCADIFCCRGPKPRLYQPMMLTPIMDGDGYWRVALNRPAARPRSTKVARLVALSFVENDAPDVKIQVDHLNSDKADDKFTNLEWVTVLEQQRRRVARLRSLSLTSSQYIGVSWVERNQKWSAQIVIEKRHKFLGYFDSDAEAARAYNAFVRERGLDHPLNVPLET